ncbi:hypothetical protein GQ44DRAFT_284835 [Phaeosphaeriaceae sp. PMI808]|nr:hypothetical protein GQ44DRAFT_284835 [Phaeosphaeriaceae sp. PMI808]
MGRGQLDPTQGISLDCTSHLRPRPNAHHISRTSITTLNFPNKFTIMEALVAVGLAGNVVQFVQGAAMLRARLKASSAILAEENQNLLNLAVECEESGNQFIAYASNVNSKSSSKVVRTVKSAIRYQWSAHKINDFVAKLDKLRNSLILATVLAYRCSMEGNNEEVLRHLKEIHQDQQARDLQDRTGDVQKAIQLIAGVIQDQTPEKTVLMQLEIEHRLGIVLALRQEIQVSKPIQLSEGSQSRERDILNWLDFRQISWRYHGVDSAYQQTYEWLFDAPSDHIEWDTFLGHLQNDTDEPFFVNGKAGSGKSTLMKFIYNHRKTEVALKQWSGANELMLLQFFFWNLGTKLQKTHVGMLRGILHTGLTQHPELIPAVLPKLYVNWNDSNTATEPEYIEMKHAFELFIEKSRYLRLAIFIDGIDEFEGDHRDMVIFLRSLASHRVKIIISSRPLNTCLEPLVGCPTLRLQDLTRKDMSIFVDGELSKHHLMTRLVQQFPCRAPQLAIDIVDKAEGVFLWVKLVVRLLVSGLENGDDLNELQASLTALPSGLRDLYKRMFGRMGMDYQKQAAIIFELNEKWLSLEDDQLLPGLILWYAINPPEALFDVPIAPIPNETYDWNMSSLVKRIQSRCCGLLELRYTQRTLDGLSRVTIMGDTVSIDDVGHLVVTYMHRTVHEFLVVDEVWLLIRSLTEGMEPTLSARLASACLSIMKAAAHLVHLTHDWYLKFASHLCREIADTSPCLAHEYLLELDHTMSELQARSPLDLQDPFLNYPPYSQHWSAELFPLAFELLDLTFFGHASSFNHDSIYTYAAVQGILASTMTLPEDIDHQARFEIALHALSSWQAIAETNYDIRKPISLRIPSLEHRLRTLTYILTNVIKSESKLSNTSLWEVALVGCQLLYANARYLESARLLQILLDTSDSPQSLWREPLQNHILKTVEPTNLLMSLKCSLVELGRAEDIILVEEIERMVDSSDSKSGASGEKHDRIPETSARSRKKGKKARRMKKMEMRASN